MWRFNIMPVFKCKRCGANLDISDGTKIVRCEFCETEQTIPLLDNEKKINLFSRANRLRARCEFDQAEALYQNIVSEFNNDAESFWGLCLCRYGIEYVDDPLSGRKIPTCHRASYESILKDSDYQQAIRLSDSVSKKLYEEEAAEIDRIQQRILSVVKNEKPYDVFICYKETDENGERTEDSVLAQDIYDSLVSKNLKVFFARITLENKLGVDYEPYIFSALNSAKVMLVVATKPEYTEAVWVKNEWGRFARLARADRSKTIIPCYRDLDPADLPTVLSTLQAQDMGKLGALQDLSRGVMKLCVKSEASGSQTSFGSASASTASLLARAHINLENSLWDKADESAEKVLDIEPKNAEAYLVKFMADRKLANYDAIPNLKDDFWNNVNYKLAMQHADESQTKTLKEFINQSKYIIATETAAQSYDPKIQNKAAELFRALNDYRDSAEMAEKCSEKAKEIIYSRALKALQTETKIPELQKAIDDFRSLGDYKDSAEKIKETKEKRKEIIYDTADKALAEARKELIYKDTYTSFKRLEELGDYKNSKAMLEEFNSIIAGINQKNAEKAEKDKILAKYDRAKMLASKNQFDSLNEAIGLFNSLGDFKDSKKQAELATERLNNVNFKAAKDAFNKHDKSSDLKKDISELERLTQTAEISGFLKNARKYVEALDLFDSAKQSGSQSKSANKAYKAAASAFIPLADINFKDSAEKLNQIRNRLGDNNAGKAMDNSTKKKIKTVVAILIAAFCIYAFLNYMDPSKPGSVENSLYARCYRLACAVLGEDAENHSDYTSVIRGHYNTIDYITGEKNTSSSLPIQVAIPSVALSLFLILFYLRFVKNRYDDFGGLEDGFITWLVSGIGFPVLYGIAAGLYLLFVCHSDFFVKGALNVFLIALVISEVTALASIIFLAILSRIICIFAPNKKK